MRYAIIMAACCAVLFFTLFAGCTSPTQAEIQPVSTPETTAAPTTPVMTATPVPTTVETVVPLPASQTVYFTVTKDRPTGKITLLCNNGPGMSSAQVIDLTVTRADGTVEDQKLTNANDLGQISGDASITLPGSLDGVDHAQVHITMGGKVYLVYDQDVGSANPYSSTYSSLDHS
ncbi:hypothetical protein Mboo_2288 [Methanoregula boonei 6A8]|uniref:Lipoprotein n=1 Tax=Methanoregula boonei (strain DSM 21154 / JCM 14090 / 6A8) TaxID=456442 RepID=A7IAP1_METB6|nr:hypothetical protein [Methanoregula boonei]ABS56802.1 hypothetical protein Mboo_2288 [Methanoregula boonei 6A8]